MRYNYRYNFRIIEDLLYFQSLIFTWLTPTRLLLMNHYYSSFTIFFRLWCYFLILNRKSSMLPTWLEHFVSFQDDPHLKFSFHTHASFHSWTITLVFIACSHFIAFLYFLCTKLYQSSHSDVSEDTWAPPPNVKKKFFGLLCP